jgi:hypothetical protein
MKMKSKDENTQVLMEEVSQYSGLEAQSHGPRQLIVSLLQVRAKWKQSLIMRIIAPMTAASPQLAAMMLVVATVVIHHCKVVS